MSTRNVKTNKQDGDGAGSYNPIFLAMLKIEGLYNQDFHQIFERDDNKNVNFDPNKYTAPEIDEAEELELIT